jgi:hypothetical protein
MTKQDLIDAFVTVTNKRLVRKFHMMTDTNDTENQDDQIPQSPSPRWRRMRLDAKAALAKAVFEASTSPQVRRRLKRGRGLAVVVSVPNASWVASIWRHVGAIIDAEKFVRDGTQRTKDLATEGNDTVASALANGRSVVGVSQSPERLLPSLLISSADLVIRVSPPDAATIATAMRLCLRGRVPHDLPRDLGTGLDFDEIVTALRPHSNPAKAVSRMQTAARARTSGAASSVVLPTLEEAIFYGAARDWGLALAADVEQAKRGLDWSLVDRGAVFFGEPGTGKTWLAAIIARACSLPLVEASVADLFGNSAGFLDSVIKAQRAVFARAAALAPCVLMWDEIEAIPNRATMSPRGRDWWLPVVDDFLLQVSSAPPGIIILGATNDIEGVDKALLRPGRLERQIEVKAAETAEGLAMILRFHLCSDLAGEDLVPLAHLGLGATAAVAMDWVRQARRTARTAGRKMILADLSAAIAPVDTRSPKILRHAAIHESAHAVITIVLGAETVRFVTIVPSNETGGRMKVDATPELGSCGRDHFERVVISLLAARAAEILFFGNAFAGAGGPARSDLGIATRLIAAMYASLGLGGSLLYRGEPKALDVLLTYDGDLRAAVEDELQKLQKRAGDLVKTHRRAIEAVADALLARRHLRGDEIAQIMDAAGSPAAVGDAPGNAKVDASLTNARSGA